MTSITTKIAGVFKYPEGKPALKLLCVDQPMILQREPTNAYDPNAIAIFANSAGTPVKLGYVPKDVAAQLKEKEISGVFKGIAWDEIRLEVKP